MKDRIIQIIAENKLSASQFADKIGVPRSGLSHVLKGRNKPSLDFVLKIIDNFPNINIQWLLTGVLNKEENNIDLPLVEQSNELLETKDSEDAATNTKLNKISMENSEFGNSNMEKIINHSLDKNQIKSNLDKIVFFYKDGSFKEFIPR